MQSRNAVALLTYRPDEAQLAFYGEIARAGADAFVVIDDNAFAWKGGHAVTPIQVDDDICAEAGFRNLNPVVTERTGRPASAWEKALYHFARVDTRYDNVWLIEDDVFISTPDALARMDRKYPAAHIVSAANEINSTGETDTWSWYKFVPEDRVPLPWAHSMVCAVRLSRDILRLVDDFLAGHATFEPDVIFPTNVVSRFARKAQYLSARLTPGQAVGGLPKCFFIEYLFHTIALRHDLSVAIAPELAGVVWQKHWTFDEIEPGGLYHPVKDLRFQEELHQKLALHSGQSTVAA
ncbi:MAG: hypothetical protein U1E28_12020 [Beijerinckiaceae bacterium]